MNGLDINPGGASKSVLVSGASFAGLTTAYWLNRLGHHVTLVEVTEGLKKGGTPVDIVDGTVDILKRMQILDEVLTYSLPGRSIAFKSADDETQARMDPEPVSDDDSANRYEIPRDDLIRILFKNIENDVEVIFNDSVATLTDTSDGVRVSFRGGAERDFAMVFGCDGNHSLVRKLRFGDESEFSHFLGHYFAMSIVDRGIIEPNATEVFSTPGKSVMLNSYENKTDICFSFHSGVEISYDYKDQEQQRRIVVDRFAQEGWRTHALLNELANADNFYFDKLCQIKMPQWSAGRVGLVGDAAYCASPAAGMGGSLAIIGATALADSLEQHGQDLQAAFAAYDRNLRPIVDEIQAEAVSFGLTTFFPETAEQIRARNEFISNPGG